MDKIPMSIGNIKFVCVCEAVELGDANDTLMESGTIDADMSSIRDSVFIQNSPFDAAANTVRKTCLNCKLDYLTMIRVGEDSATIYTCKCGWSMSHLEYMKTINVSQSIKK
jgi:hypothetical protein